MVLILTVCVFLPSFADIGMPVVGDPFYNAGHMQRILRGCAVDGWDFENLTLPQWLHPQVGLGLQAFHLEFPDPHHSGIASAVALSGSGDSSQNHHSVAAPLAGASGASASAATSAPAVAIERKDGRIRVSVAMPAEWQSMQPAPIGSFRTL